MLGLRPHGAIADGPLDYRFHSLDGGVKQDCLLLSRLSGRKSGCRYQKNTGFTITIMTAATISSVGTSLAIR